MCLVSVEVGLFGWVGRWGGGGGGWWGSCVVYCWVGQKYYYNVILQFMVQHVCGPCGFKYYHFHLIVV